MGALIWGGAAVTMLGVWVLLWCAMQSIKAKSLPDDQARALMQRVVVWNLAAMGIAVLGLMSVVAGLFLR